MFRMLTNVQLCGAVRLMGIQTAIGSRKSPAATESVETKTCKKAMLADFYCNARVVVWNLLQILKQKIVSLTMDMASEKTVLNRDAIGSVADCSKQRVALVAQVG